MSNAQLPQFISPRKMARQGHIIEGTLPVSAMKRMEGLLVDVSGEMVAHLGFSIDIEGFSVVSGTVQGQVIMRCERCMGTTPVDVLANVSLACVYTDEQAESLPERYEPLFTNSDQTDFYALVEDELLLSIPIIAYHPDGECSFGPSSFGEGEVLEAEVALTDGCVESQDCSSNTHPFAVLAQLKSRT